MEDRIFPHVEIDELESGLLIKVRKLANNQKINHPWTSMEDIEVLRSAGLYLKDPNNSKVF